MKHNITAVILYCSLDKRFFKHCVKNLLECGIKVQVVAFDHLFGGEPDEIELYDHEDVNYKMLACGGGPSPLRYEAIARWSGLHQTNSQYTLFIDPDEIVDPIPFKAWLDTGDYLHKKSWKLRQYGYLLHPTYRIHKPMYNTILCETSYAKSLPFKVAARWDAYWNNTNRISRWTGKLGINKDFGIYRGEPFIHHYTSVRSLEEMQKKVKNWSHAPDRNDWADKVSKMWREANEKQIGGLTYDVVENKFGIDETGLYKV